MMKLKKPFMTALVNGILRLSALETSTHNPYTKKEIQDEITSMVKILIASDDFVDFVFKHLQSEKRIRADERMNISFENHSAKKTGPLDNKILKEKPNET